MSGFTLVIIVMLIMFAAVAIVMTQDDEPATPESIDEDQEVLAESDGPEALAAPEIVLADEIFTESDTLRIDVLDSPVEERRESESLPLPAEEE